MTTEEWQWLYWDDMPLLYMDFETSGFTRDDRICELALIIARKGEVLQSYEARVNPMCEIDEGATAVHGISNEDVDHLPTFEDLFPEFRHFFFWGAPWVSHNMPFDMRMLDYSWSYKEWPRGIPSLCSLAYSKKHPTTKMRRKHKLVDLANYFNVHFEPGELHGAMYDTQLLSQVVPLMMGRRTIGETMSKYNHEWREGK